MPDHDSLYHRLFAHPLMVEQVVRGFVPEAMALDIDFMRMRRVNAKFHGAKFHGRWRRREGDVIWRLPTHDGGDLILYLLLEFQSRIDWFMAVRAQVYEGLLWQQLIEENGLKRGDRLPPCLTLVLYNGGPRWTAPERTGELIALPATSPLWPYQPQVRYHVLDMGAFPADDLAGRQDSLAALLFQLEQRHEPEALAGLIGRVVDWFARHPDHAVLRTLFTDLVRQAIEGYGPPGIALPGDMMEAETMLATIGAEWREQWKAQGLAEGRNEGLAEGRNEGLAEGRAEGRVQGMTRGKAEIFLRLLAKRFGTPSEEVQQRVANADAAMIDQWADRLLTAPSLDAVFVSDE